MELKPGTRINRFELKQRLGSGGQGSVWEAVDLIHGGAPRALKLVPLRDLERHAAERAWREAQALQGVAHACLVPCRELFRDSVEDLIGLVFDLIQGQPLSAAAHDPRMSPAAKEGVLKQLADVLSHVHSLGIVHRDLKPDNILITDAFWTAPSTPGGVKLVDFGISAPAGNPSPLTTHGAVVGTIPYLPPELMLIGPIAPDREGFARDVFAFGVLGWQLCLGAHPTGLALNAPYTAYRDLYHEAWEHKRAWPPAAASTPWLDALRACLALDPQQRPQDGKALLDLLDTRRPSASKPRAPLTSSHSVQTAPHTPPTAARTVATSAQTPIFYTDETRKPAVSAPPVVPTAPMHVSPPMPPPPSIPHPPSASSSPQKSGASSLLLGFALLGAATCGAFGFWLFSSRATSGEESLPPPIMLQGQPVATLSPETSGGSANTDSTVPCCHEQQACVSGRACNSTRACQDKPLPEKTWSLRVSGVRVTEGNQDLTGTHPSATVCLYNTRTSQTACAPLSKVAREGGDREDVLAVTTQDLEYGRLRARVVEAGKELYPETRIADNRDGIKNSVLCRGFRLRVGPRESAPLHVFVYLD